LKRKKESTKDARSVSTVRHLQGQKGKKSRKGTTVTLRLEGGRVRSST